MAAAAKELRQRRLFHFRLATAASGVASERWVEDAVDQAVEGSSEVEEFEASPPTAGGMEKMVKLLAEVAAAVAAVVEARI